MPSRDYDPRRYGPTVSAGVSCASRDVRSAPASTLSEASERRAHNDNLQFAKSLRSLRGTRAERVGAGFWTDSHSQSQQGVGVGSRGLASCSDDGATPKEERCERF